MFLLLVVMVVDIILVASGEHNPAQLSSAKRIALHPTQQDLAVWTEGLMDGAQALMNQIVRRLVLQKANHVCHRAPRYLC